MSSLCASRRSLILILAACAVGAVVAVSSNGLQVLVPAMDLPGGRLRSVRLAGILVALVGMAALLIQRRRIRSDGWRGSDPVVVALRTAAAIMGLLTLLALLNPVASGGRADSEGAFSSLGVSPWGLAPPAGDSHPSYTRGGTPFWQGHRPEGDDAASSGPVQPRDDWLARRLLARVAEILLLILLLTLGAMGAARRLKKRPRATQPPVPLPPADAQASLDATLAELAQPGRSARQQIIAAYRRLLVALAEAGAPRRPEEAPHEHLHRVLDPLGVRGDPLHRLAGLYVMAQFSELPVTGGHRTQAIDALRASMADLRRPTGPGEVHSAEETLT